MVPGIHNLSTVGSSPLKRGARRVADNQRDIHYIGLGSAAGTLSSKVNLNKVLLPAMDRELKNNTASHPTFSKHTPIFNTRNI
jgi:hypothetical protein